MGTKLLMSIAFHPATDGKTERIIQTLEDMLRSCVIEYQGSWEDYLDLIEFSYNNSHHASIGIAPFEALYGRKCRDCTWARVYRGHREASQVNSGKDTSRPRSTEKLCRFEEEG